MALHPAISINTLSLAPAPLAAQVETIARIGAAGITPDLAQLQDTGIAASLTLLRDSGLAVAAITHRAFGFATPAEDTDARHRLLRTIEIASRAGASAIVMTTGGRGGLDWSEAAKRFADAMTPCAEAARTAGIALGIEPTSHLYSDVSIVHRLSDAVAVAQAADIAVVMDLFACWVDADIDAAIAAAGPISRVVQVSDYVYGDRGLPCRAVPGDGAMPWPHMIPAIVAAGFTGWFDLEIIGPRLQTEGQEAGLARAAAFIGGLLEQSRG